MIDLGYVVNEVNVSFEGKFDEINAFNETGTYDETVKFDEINAFNETGTYDETVKFDERDKFEFDCSFEGKLDETSKVEFDCSFKDVFNASSVLLASSLVNGYGYPYFCRNFTVYGEIRPIYGTVIVPYTVVCMSYSHQTRS